MKIRDVYLWSYIWFCRALLITLSSYVTFCLFTGQVAWGATYSTVQGVTQSNRIITGLTGQSLSITSNGQSYPISPDAKFAVAESQCRKSYDSVTDRYIWTCWYTLLGETGWYLSGSKLAQGIAEPNVCKMKVPVNNVPDYLTFDIYDPVCTMGCH